MIIGVPREVKSDEYRVGMLPVGAELLTQDGHTVLVERGAGLGSGHADADYQAAGAELVEGPQAVYGRAELVVKVKEPQPAEIEMLRAGQTLFTYFHFAADRELTEGCLTRRHHGRGLRDARRRPRPAAAADAHERDRRQDVHPGRREVPRAAR